MCALEPLFYVPAGGGNFPLEPCTEAAQTEQDAAAAFEETRERIREGNRNRPADDQAARARSNVGLGRSV